MERKNKPSAIPTSQSLPQPHLSWSDDKKILTAHLPTYGDTVTINLYGATVTSWTTSPNNAEQLFLSSAAHLDGSKPIRGGIPLVFPVFGAAPKNHATGKLPQHGFARNNYWQFMGSTSSESLGEKTDDSVRLDFGLGSSALDEATRQKWPHEFTMVYSVTLGKARLGTSMQVRNTGGQGWEFMCLFHSYLRVKDISTTSLSGLKSSPYVDKVRAAKSFTESSDNLTITSETDRVYTPPADSEGKLTPITVLENGKPKLTVSRDALPDVTVWNLWEEKAKGMADFAPKDGWKQFVAVEPGAVSNWIKLEAGDAWEGGLVMEAKL